MIPQLHHVAARYIRRRNHLVKMEAAARDRGAGDREKGKTMDYSKMTNEEFDAILAEIVKEMGANVLYVPGVYEHLAEHLNNEVLDTWQSRRELAECD